MEQRLLDSESHLGSCFCYSDDKPTAALLTLPTISYHCLAKLQATWTIIAIHPKAL